MVQIKKTIAFNHYNKFSAKKTEVDGKIFDSKMEARRYGELKLHQISGALKELQTHHDFDKFPLTVNGRKIGTYKPDFLYKTKNNKVHAEDVKGFRTRDYRMKAELFQALYPEIEFHEITYKNDRIRSKK